VSINSRVKKFEVFTKSEVRLSMDEEEENLDNSSSSDQSDTANPPSPERFFSTTRRPSSSGPARRAPGRRPGTHNKTAQTAIAFHSHMTREESEKQLFQLFGSTFRLAGVNACAMSDRLSVHDLRIVIRVLDLLPSDKVNVRKPLLVDCLQAYFRSERMLTLHDQYMAELPPERVASPPPVPPPKPVRRTQERGPPTRRLVNDEPKKSILVPRLKYDKTFQTEAALEFVLECNRFMQQLSDRISELERAVSILLARIVELEVYYGLE
jgi:hypothetical protein